MAPKRALSPVGLAPACRRGFQSNLLNRDVRLHGADASSFQAFPRSALVSFLEILASFTGGGATGTDLV